MPQTKKVMISVSLNNYNWLHTTCVSPSAIFNIVCQELQKHNLPKIEETIKKEAKEIINSLLFKK